MNDDSSSLVCLSHKDVISYMAQLQGPIRDAGFDSNSRKEFSTLNCLNTYPQGFIAHTFSGEVYVKASFDEPSPSFTGQLPESKMDILTKECIKLFEEDKSSKVKEAPVLVSVDSNNPC